jgi:hypothetical protein
MLGECIDVRRCSCAPLHQHQSKPALKVRPNAQLDATRLFLPDKFLQPICSKCCAQREMQMIHR